eukprot:Gb_27082 [translate_table: standard]
MSDQLASKRESSENEYCKLQGVEGQEQQTKKEAIVLQLRGELDSVLSKFLLERESCLGENEESEHWRERARVLAGRANAILEDTLPLTSSA